MAQQTAVEKLVSTIQSMIEHGADLGEDYPALLVHIQQAKETEKQQHGNTWDQAIKAHENRGHVIARSLCDFDDYYNETYGNKTKNK
jgi:hypothetical protein